MRSFSFRLSRGLGLLVVTMLLEGLFSPADAQEETGYYFLRIPPSAQAATLGNGTAAETSPDIHQFLYNPAVLSGRHHQRISLSYLNHLGDINAGGVAYAHELPGVGTLGAGIRYLGYGTFDRTDATGERTGSFVASDAAISLGLGRSYTENLKIGATGHAVFSSIANSRATAVAFDAGFLYYYAPFELTLGGSVNNLGRELSGIGTSTGELPLDIRLTLSKQLQYVPLLLSVTGYELNSAGDNLSTPGDLLRDHVRFGGVLQLASAFEVRFGYNPRRHEAMKVRSRLDLAGLSVGFGLSLFRINFDYAYESWSSFGGLHYLTLGTQL